MWQLMRLYLISFGQPGSVIEGAPYGPPQTLTCEWFTNFENSRFGQCKTPTGTDVPLGEGASVKCLKGICDQLDAEARRASHSTDRSPPSGIFTVRLVGRLSLYQHPKRYLGDGTSTVLIEKLIAVRKSQ